MILESRNQAKIRKDSESRRKSRVADPSVHIQRDLVESSTDSLPGLYKSLLSSRLHLFFIILKGWPQVNCVVSRVKAVIRTFVKSFKILKVSIKCDWLSINPPC